MALTDTQKAKCRRYLGYPDVNRRAYSELEGAFASLSTAGETEVGSILTQISALETSATGLTGTDRVGISRIEDVHFDGSSGLVNIHDERRRLIAELGALLDITPMSGRTSGFLPRG